VQQPELKFISSSILSTTALASANANFQVAGVADFDGDGKADILWRNSTSGTNVLWRMDGGTRLSTTPLADANSDFQVAGW
jgi:hypothetical protein